MSWLNSPEWRALKVGRIEIDGEPHAIAVVECGELILPSGHLVAEDPFVSLQRDNSYYLVPPGTYPVRVTVDETIQREMYVSLILAAADEVERSFLTPYKPSGERYLEPDPDAYYGIGVDSGTVCYVDGEAVKRGMPPDAATWYDELFDNKSDNCWFRLMDNPAHIRAGLANIGLPSATDGSNLILSHSGWGDGFYPVVGGCDAQGELVAVHIDLLIHTE
jgi:hypothetical protein